MQMKLKELQEKLPNLQSRALEIQRKAEQQKLTEEAHREMHRALYEKIETWNLQLAGDIHGKIQEEVEQSESVGIFRTLYQNDLPPDIGPVEEDLASKQKRWDEELEFIWFIKQSTTIQT